MVIQPQYYIPSRVGEWDRLYHLIQRQGYQNGMHLTIGSGSYKRGGWTIICVRGRIYPKKLQILNNIDEQTSSQCFSPQSKPQNLRRVKNKNSNKKKRPEDSLVKRHTQTKKPLISSHCCKFLLYINFDDDKDVFIIKVVLAIITTLDIPSTPEMR